MKLLGWLHGNFRREAAPVDPYMDFVRGSQPCSCLSWEPSLEEVHPHHQHHPRPLTRPPFLPQPNHRLRREGSCCKAMPEEHEASARQELLFQGLLAIGTLGSAPKLEENASRDPPPPFSLPPPHPFHSIVVEEEPSEETGSSVVATNADQLEKVLVPVGADENDPFPPARVTHVKKGEKRERSTGGVQKMVRKMLKRPGGTKAGAAAAPAAGAGPETAAAAAMTKLYKILQVFHRKVHPEGSIAQKKQAKSQSWDTHTGTSSGGGGGGGGGDGEAMMFSTRAFKRGGATCCFSCESHPPAMSGQSSHGSNGSREHWIRTDADYLVLEL